MSWGWLFISFPIFIQIYAVNNEPIIYTDERDFQNLIRIITLETNYLDESQKTGKIVSGDIAKKMRKETREKREEGRISS